MAVTLKSEERHFILKLAESADELIAAQRLRYRVFVTELGATGPTVDHANQREFDDFDCVYDHLLLIDRRRDAASLDHVVGVYRLLRGEVALAGPGFYSAAEYDLGPLLRTNRRLLVLIEATPERLLEIVAAQPVLRQLIVNRWILVAAFDPETARAWYFDEQGFVPYEPESKELPTVRSSVDWYGGERGHRPPATILAGCPGARRSEGRAA